MLHFTAAVFNAPSHQNMLQLEITVVLMVFWWSAVTVIQIEQEEKPDVDQNDVHWDSGGFVYFGHIRMNFYGIHLRALLWGSVSP